MDVSVRDDFVTVVCNKKSVILGLAKTQLLILMKHGGLEQRLNQLLCERWKLLNSDSELQQKFISIFAQGNHFRMGVGEKPTWSPNESYMASLEWLWQPAEELLNLHQLATDEPLRILFEESREYLDDETEHRRIFYGQIVDASTKLGITAFMLTVPHSHRCFCYPAPVTIQISNLLAL